MNPVYKIKRQIESIILSLPAFLIYSFIIIYPIFMVFRLSFFKWNGIPNLPMEFTGFTNYVSFFMDTRFRTALFNIIVFMCSGFILILPISLFLATVIQK
jgi:ABC-type sugar transport system permease subunit